MAPGYDLLRTVTKTSREPVETLVHGVIPSWLTGSMYRNGPGQFELKDKGYKHLFDGHALVHKFKIADGKVFYSSNFLKTNSYTKSVEENRLYHVFGTADLCSKLYGRMQVLFKYPDTLDNTNVNILPFGDSQLYALTETNYMCKVDSGSLSVTDTLNVKKFIDTASTTIAHPHIDSNGNWITMGQDMKRKKHLFYEFIRYKNDSSVNERTKVCEKGEVIGRLPSSHSNGLAYFHSFGLTENYIIFFEQSLKFDVKQFAKNLVLNRPYSDALIMNRDFKTRIHIMNRNTGEVHRQKFLTEPLMVFHHINAYEKSGEIIVDVCAYDAQHFEINFLSREGMFTEKCLGHKGLKSIARRITVPFKSDYVVDAAIDCKIHDINAEVVFELPS
jgi:carotenoid cleavage dioxygenase-like enzyme